MKCARANARRPCGGGRHLRCARKWRLKTLACDGGCWAFRSVCENGVRKLFSSRWRVQVGVYRVGIGKAWATLGARWLGLQCANVKKAAGKARCSSQPLGRVVAFRGGDPCPFPALLCLRRRTRHARRTGSTRRTRSPGRSARCRRPGCGSLEGLPALRAFLGAHVIAYIVALHANPCAHRRRCWSETHGSSILISLALHTCRPWRSRP